MSRNYSVFLCIVLTGFMLLATAAQAQNKDGNSGILYGEDHAFGFQAPKGWTLDNQSGVEQGLDAVFYPVGQTWEHSPIIAYARALSKEAHIKRADDAVQDTLKGFRSNNNPHSQAKKVSPIVIDKTRTAQVYYYTGDKWGRFEAVAYVVEGKTINFFVMSSKNQKDFKKSLPAFQSLVKSYIYMGDSPLAAPKKPKPLSGAEGKI